MNRSRDEHPAGLRRRLRRPIEGLRAALADARDYVGYALAQTWKRLQADNFSYLDVAEALIATDEIMSGGRYRRARSELRLARIGA